MYTFVSDRQLLAPIPRLLVFGFICLLAYLVSVVVYRLLFHPLAKYPGPFLAKISSLHSAYHHSMQDDGHLNFYRMHLKYGPVYRYAPGALSFNSAAALHDIHGPKANCQKATFYHALPLVPGVWSVASVVDKTAHARKRRILARGFTEKAVRSMEPCVLPHIRDFCQVIEDSVSEVPRSLNVATLTNRLAFDIMGDFCFGRSFNMQRDSKNRYFRDLIVSNMRITSLFAKLRWMETFQVDKWFPPLTRLMRGRNQFGEFAAETMRARLNSTRSKIDVISYVNGVKDAETGRPFDELELVGEAGTLVVAGSDTTSTTIAAAMYYLSQPKNQHVFRHMREELFQHFGDDDVERIVAGPDLNACSYTRAVIDEVLRLAPPVPGILPREVMVGGCKIDGRHIPVGFDVSVPIYALHHNETYYEDPFAFKPERWLQEGKEKQELKVLLNAFTPFGIGPRGCLGKGMAYMELMLTLGRVVWLYDFVKDDGSDEISRGWHEEYALKDYLTAEKDGPVLKFIPR